MGKNTVKTILILSLFGNAVALIVAWALIQRFGGPELVYFRFKNPEVVTNQVHRKSILSNLKVEQSDIIMLGNSLTAYCEWAELLSNPDFKNRGIPGESIDGIRNRLPGILHHNPERVFLMIGINDLMYHQSEEVLRNYEALIRENILNINSTDLVIQEIMPINSMVQRLPTTNSEIKRVNAGLKMLASKYKLNFLPLFERISDQDGQLPRHFTDDGLHLKAPAYEVWKNAILDYLSNS